MVSSFVATYDHDFIPVSIFFVLTVYVFLGDYHALIDFVRSMHDKPETNTGEYVVIAVDQRPYFTNDDNKYFLKRR